MNVVENPSQKGRYRIEAQVSALEPNRKESKTAYYGPTHAYPFSKPDADTKQAALQGSTSPSCWVKRSAIASISLVEVTGDAGAVARARSALYVAWTTTFIAAVVGMFTLIFASHWMNEFLGAGGEEEGTEEKNKPVLNVEQAKHVCDVFASEVKREQTGMANWVCSVCFDENEEVASIRTVLLPCEHRFHRQYVLHPGFCWRCACFRFARTTFLLTTVFLYYAFLGCTFLFLCRCIKKWLRRGKSACPLCNWDAKTLFDSDGKPSSFSDGEQAGGEEGTDAEEECARGDVDADAVEAGEHEEGDMESGVGTLIQQNDPMTGGP